MKATTPHKILFFTSRPPYPLISGVKIRMFSLGEVLNKKYKTDLLFLNEGKVKSETIRCLSKVFNKVIPFSFDRLSFKFNTLKGVSSKLPIQVHYYHFKKVQKWINKNYENYDLIFCQHVRTAEYVKNLSIKKVIDLVDAISLNYFRTPKETKGIWKYLKFIERNRVLNYELECINKFGKSFIVSAIDKEFLIKNGAEGSKIKVIPIAVRNEVLERYEERYEEENSLVFLGKMDYRPNIDAVSWFCKNIFPLILEENSKIRFYIIGPYPTKEIKKLENQNIIVTGFVDNPYQYIKRAKVFVAPMVSGAGIQTKILEAMALEKPVVTTTIGAEGIEGNNGVHFFTVDRPEDYATKIINLMKDKERRKYLGGKARKLILEKYTWQRVGKMFVDEIGNVLGDWLSQT